MNGMVIHKIYQRWRLGTNPTNSHKSISLELSWTGELSYNSSTKEFGAD